MARTVTVELKMKTTDWVAGGEKAIAELKALGAEVKVLGDNVKTTGKSTSEFSRLVTANLKDGETAFQSLTRRSGELRSEITKLRAEFHKTGDISALGGIKSAERDLRGISRFLGNMTEEGAQAGETFASSFGKNATALLPDLLTNPVGLAVAAGVVTVAVPIIGGAVAGAVGAGVGLGLIGAAAMIQKDNPAIQGAFGQLKDDAVSVFKTATQPLVGTFVDALDSVDTLLKSQGPQFAAIFAAVEPAIKPIVGDLEALEKGVLPGLQRTAEGFTKAVSNPEVQQSVVALGKSFTALFNAVGNNPQVIADAFVAVNTTLSTTASILDGLVHAAGFVDSLFHGSGKNSIKEFGGAAVVAGQQTSQLSGIMVTTHDYALKMGAATDAVGKSVQSMGEHSGTATGAVDGLGAAVGTTTQQAKIAKVDLGALSQQINATAITSSTLAGQMEDKLFNALMSADQASLSWNESLTNLSVTLKSNHNIIDENAKSTIKHRQAAEADKGAILAAVSANQQIYQSMIASGISAKDAAGAYDKNEKALRRQLLAAGLTKKQVDGLIGSYDKVPDKVNTLIAVKGLTAAIDNLNATLLLLNHIDGFHAHASVTTTYYTKGKPHTGPLSQSFNRWGGVYEPAADGLLTHAQVYSPVNPGRFMIAEPQTKGEAFIPKVGDYGRSMSILSAAAGWYGARVIEGGGRSGGGGVPISVTITAADPQARAFLAAARFTVQQNGGDVVKVFTPR